MPISCGDVCDGAVLASCDESTTAFHAQWRIGVRHRSASLMFRCRAGGVVVRSDSSTAVVSQRLMARAGIAVVISAFHEVRQSWGKAALQEVDHDRHGSRCTRGGCAEETGDGSVGADDEFSALLDNPDTAAVGGGDQLRALSCREEFPLFLGRRGGGSSAEGERTSFAAGRLAE